MQKIYEQFLIDIPRLNVTIEHKPFKDSPVECIRLLKQLYGDKCNYAMQIAIQSTLEPYFSQFSKSFNTFTQVITDGGTEYIHYEDKETIILYKLFNLVHIQTEQIKKVLLLKIEFNPQTYTHKACWKSMDTQYSLNWLQDWDIISNEIEEPSSWTNILYEWLFPIYSNE